MVRAAYLLYIAIPILAACSRKPARSAPLPWPQAATPVEGPSPEGEPREPTGNPGADESDRERRRLESLRAVMQEPVYFAYDRFDLSSDARETLSAKLGLLEANPGVSIRIEGHADERGSAEYNIALGQQRAAAAKRFLTQRGIAGSRIETVSFGEEQPLCTNAVESCWSRNRRDQFMLTAGNLTANPR